MSRAPVMSLFVSLLVAGAARAAPFAETRYALIVGAHTGGSGEATLSYAGRDARRVSEVLIELGGFLPDNVVTLVDPDAARMRDAFARLNARLRAEHQPGRPSVLFVYYSGHADPKALHLGDSALPWDELVNSVQASSAELRLLVVDACRAGFATRVKGLKPDEGPFVLPIVSQPVAEGMAILASATQGEDAQESDAIEASFFTHHLLAGLRGAADQDDDALVTLEEAYRYARDQTVASTATSAGGIQHPTYRYDFKGRANVVLTTLDATRSHGRLILPGDGRFLVHEERGDGPLAAEVQSRGAGTAVVLPSGRYVVRWRRPDRYLEGPVTVVAARDVFVTPAQMQVFEYARLVRKGGGGGNAAQALVLGGLAAPALDDYSAAWSVALGFSVDFEALGVDVVGYYGMAHSSGAGLEARDHEIGALVGVRKSFDLGQLALGLGVRVGGILHVQDYASGEPGRARLVPAVEVPVRAEVLLGGAWSLVMELGARATPLEIVDGLDGQRASAWLGVFARLGLGVAL